MLELKQAEEACDQDPTDENIQKGECLKLRIESLSEYIVKVLARHLYSGLLGRKLHPGSPILLLSLPRGIKAAYSLRSSVSIVPAIMVTE